MKRLYILRHAHTQPAGEGGDRERVLTAQGQHDAQTLGQTMREKNYMPDFILCSPATRTRQTLDGVVASLRKTQTEYAKMIYEGGYNELVKLVQRVDDKFLALLIVGHNPSIHQFAANFAQDSGGPLMNRLATGYPPGTLCVLDIPHASWVDVTPGENTLIDLIEA